MYSTLIGELQAKIYTYERRITEFRGEITQLNEKEEELVAARTHWKNACEGFECAVNQEGHRALYPPDRSMTRFARSYSTIMLETLFSNRYNLAASTFEQVDQDCKKGIQHTCDERDDRQRQIGILQNEIAVLQVRIRQLQMLGG
ncbi:MAG: hypothetical protein LBP24_01320 [Coriobacteriales bacterium]|jgi:peptidoglycan hydrolase CwlO-like protein|nr:hypothetical protein [Coriobacteriales bacterium]